MSCWLFGVDEITRLVGVCLMDLDAERAHVAVAGPTAAGIRHSQSLPFFELTGDSTPFYLNMQKKSRLHFYNRLDG
jgi:hypothetical protein